MKTMKPIRCAALLTLLSACSVGPDYVRPTVATPVEFKESATWKVAQPRDDARRSPWWELYDDSRLNELMERVAVSNQSLKSAEAQYRQARALVRAAASGYHPQVGAGAAVDRTRGSSSMTATTHLLSVDASWELDLWGRVRRGVEASRAEAQATAAELESLALSLRAELATDYFQLRTIDAQIRLLDETVSSYGQYLELTRNRHEAGVVSQADVLQAETQLKNSQAQAMELGVQRARLEHAIAILTGRAPAEFTLPSMPLDSTPPPFPPGLPSRLLERRPDVAAAERRVAAANARIGVAAAAYFPAVTLSATAGFAAAGLADWLSWPSRVWALGSAVAQSVYDGGLRGAQLDEARAAHEATVADYRQVVLGAFREVEDNLAALAILEQESAVQEEALRAARQLLAIATNQYGAGVVGYLNVIIAQATALNTERNSIDVLGRRMVASVGLIRGVGGGWNAAELAERDGAGTGNPGEIAGNSP